MKGLPCYVAVVVLMLGALAFAMSGHELLALLSLATAIIPARLSPDEDYTGE